MLCPPACDAFPDFVAVSVGLEPVERLLATLPVEMTVLYPPACDVFPGSVADSVGFEPVE